MLLCFGAPYLCGVMFMYQSGVYVLGIYVADGKKRDQVIRKILDDVLVSERDRRYYIYFYGLLRKYWDRLSGMDVRSIVLECLDLLDNSLGVGENTEVIRRHIEMYAGVSSRLDMDYYLGDSGGNELINEIDEAIAGLLELRRRAEMLLGAEEKLVERLNKLLYSSGCVERKWVKNRNGRKYWYWYLRWYQDGKKKSKYLGKKLPENILRNMEKRKEATKILKQLRETRKQITEIQKKLDRIHTVLL